MSGDKPVVCTGIHVVEKTDNDDEYSGKSTGYTINLKGDRQNYSAVGDIGGYENAVVNAGNGPLGVMDYTEAKEIAEEDHLDLDSIGRYVIRDVNDDTDRPKEASEPEHCDSAGKKAEKTEDPAPASEPAEVTEQASAVDPKPSAVTEQTPAADPEPAAEPSEETVPALDIDPVREVEPAPEGEPALEGEPVEASDPLPESEPAADEGVQEEPATDDSSSGDESSDDSDSDDTDNESDGE